MGGTSIHVRCRPNYGREVLSYGDVGHLYGRRYEGCNNPLVITPVFRRDDKRNVHLHQVFVDMGESVDILYWNAFTDLRLFRTDLLPNRPPFRGFGQAEVLVVGKIAVPHQRSRSTWRKGTSS